MKQQSWRSIERSFNLLLQVPGWVSHQENGSKPYCLGKSHPNQIFQKAER